MSVKLLSTVWEGKMYTDKKKMIYFTFIWRKRMNLVAMGTDEWERLVKIMKNIKEIQQEFDNKVRYSFHIPGIYFFFLQ